MNTDAELPLEPAPITARELALHHEALLAAFQQSGVYRHGITFEHAMNTPPLRICLTTAAEIKAKKLLERAA